ncbi:hypothetical protein C8R46DRAFT_1201123 [Mycena filopes]|nr:hypothetical protein C8R46DRAFT_1201123 [Mycena filopes]
MDIDNPSSPPSTAILAPFNLSDVSFRLEAATYQAELARLHAYFAGGSPCNNLKIFLGDTPGDTPHRVIADIIQPYASRLTSLDLHIDADVVENLLRLPLILHIRRFAHTSLHESSQFERAGVCRLVVRFEEGYDGGNVERFTLPALNSLSVNFGRKGFGAAEAFWEPLIIPAVKLLDTCGSYASNVIECLQRSGTTLSTLCLRDARYLREEEFTELVSPQATVTDLDLTNCKGAFWRSLAQHPPTLLPALRHFIYNEMTTWDIPSIIAFIDARCAATPEISLKTVSLAAIQRHADYENGCSAAAEIRRLEGAIERWSMHGIEVAVERMAGTDCDYCFGDDAEPQGVRRSLRVRERRANSTKFGYGVSSRR